MKRMFIATTTAVALAGCGGGSHPASAPAATLARTPSPSPSPTPTVLTMKQARAAYLALVTPTNVDISNANKIMTSSAPSLAALHRVARKARIDAHRFAIGLRTTLWPADVKPVALRLADAVAVEVTTWTALSKDSAAQANADWETFAGTADKGSAYAEQMREHLGLPPAK